MMKRILIYILLLLITLGVFYAYYEYNRGPASLEKQTADLEISAEELLTSFLTDEQSANEKFLDKVVLVSGRIEGIEKEEKTNSIILDANDPMARIVCEMEALPPSLKEGDQVSIKARCTGFLIDVILVQGVALETE